MDLDFRQNPSVLGPIVDALAEGVFTLDREGRCVGWSAGAQRFSEQERWVLRRDGRFARPARSQGGPARGLSTQLAWRASERPLALDAQTTTCSTQTGRKAA